MGIAFGGIRADARDEMRYGDSDERERALRLDAADARENAGYSGGSYDADVIARWLERIGHPGLAASVRAGAYR